MPDEIILEIPGDPEAVRTAGRAFSSLGTQMARIGSTLNGTETTTLQGSAADAMRAKAEKVTGGLQADHTVYFNTGRRLLKVAGQMEDQRQQAVTTLSGRAVGATAATVTGLVYVTITWKTGGVYSKVRNAIAADSLGAVQDAHRQALVRIAAVVADIGVKFATGLLEGLAFAVTEQGVDGKPLFGPGTTSTVFGTAAGGIVGKGTAEYVGYALSLVPTTSLVDSQTRWIAVGAAGLNGAWQGAVTGAVDGAVSSSAGTYAANKFANQTVDWGSVRTAAWIGASFGGTAGGLVGGLKGAVTSSAGKPALLGLPAGVSVAGEAAEGAGSAGTGGGEGSGNGGGGSEGSGGGGSEGSGSGSGSGGGGSEGSGSGGNESGGGSEGGSDADSTAAQDGSNQSGDTDWESAQGDDRPDSDAGSDGGDNGNGKAESTGGAAAGGSAAAGGGAAAAGGSSNPQFPGVDEGADGLAGLEDQLAGAGAGG